MQLSLETRRDIFDWFRACYPQEGCGLLDSAGQWVPLVNVAAEPERNFRIAPGLVEAHGARALLHSHPGGWRCPSRTDMETQAAQNIVLHPIVISDYWNVGRRQLCPGSGI